MPVNANIVAFARENLNTQVGGGECWDLAERALRAAGIRRPNADDHYVWGDVVRMTQMQPGDIIQFDSFQYNLRIERSNSDGTSSWRDESESRGNPNHTAIIASIGSNGSVQVWEQNVQGIRRVRQRRLYLIATTWEEVDGQSNVVNQVTVSGSFTIYHAVARP